MWKIEIQTADWRWHHFETFDGTAPEFVGVGVKAKARNWVVQLVQQWNCADRHIQQQQ